MANVFLCEVLIEVKLLEIIPQVTELLVPAHSPEIFLVPIMFWPFVYSREGGG